MLKEFKTEKEAKEYGERENFSKYQWERVIVDGKKTILCGTCIPYEDTFYPFAEELIERFFGDAKEGEKESFFDEAELRDELLEVFEKYTGYEFLDVWDEF